MPRPHPRNDRPRSDRPKRDKDGLVAERRCLVLGQLLPRDQLIRFVPGPGREIVPDLAETLPGHGLWVSATRAALTEAVKKKLFSKAAKQPIAAGPELPDRVEALLHRRCLELLGLTRRAGLPLMGADKVDAGFKADGLALLLEAADGGRDAGDNHRKAERAGIPVFRSLTAEEMGHALGRAPVVHVGLPDHPLTDQLLRDLKRRDGMRGEAISAETPTNTLPLLL
jgi:uncharacterized protein